MKFCRQQQRPLSASSHSPICSRSVTIPLNRTEVSMNSSINNNNNDKNSNNQRYRKNDWTSLVVSRLKIGKHQPAPPPPTSSISVRFLHSKLSIRSNENT